MGQPRVNRRDTGDAGVRFQGSGVRGQGMMSSEQVGSADPVLGSAALLQLAKGSGAMKEFEYVMLSAAKHLGVSFKTNTLRSFALLRMTGLADFFTPSLPIPCRGSPQRCSLQKREQNSRFGAHNRLGFFRDFAQEAADGQGERVVQTLSEGTSYLVARQL